MIFRYYWQDIDAQVARIGNSIKRKEITSDIIVGIARGGLIPATLLAYRMNLPICSLQWQSRDLDKSRDYNQLRDILCSFKSIILIDDILDSGNTLREINDYIGVLHVKEPDQYAAVNFVVCVKRTELESPVPNLIFGDELANFDWVHFPWGD
jgi:hypoxanthine phosphoribosyltransferase